MSENQEYVYGINPIYELLKNHPTDLVEILIARDRKDPRLSHILELAESNSILIHNRPNTTLSKLADNEHHQGIVGVVRAFSYTTWEDFEKILFSNKESGLNSKVLILDGIQDPGNLGALIRTAYWMGITAIIIPKDRAAGVTPVARKASSGASEYIPIIKVVNIARTMETLFSEHGVWMLGIDQSAKESIETIDTSNISIGLVLGNEGSGLRTLVKKNCHWLASINSKVESPKIDSLNVSVAGAIAMYAIGKSNK